MYVRPTNMSDQQVAQPLAIGALYTLSENGTILAIMQFPAFYWDLNDFIGKKRIRHRQYKSL